jgi:hypothetical protein
MTFIAADVNELALSIFGLVVAVTLGENPAPAPGH